MASIKKKDLISLSVAYFSQILVVGHGLSKGRECVSGSLKLCISWEVGRDISDYERILRARYEMQVQRPLAYEVCPKNHLLRYDETRVLHFL